MNKNLMNKQKTNTNVDITDGVADIIEGITECVVDADAVSDVVDGATDIAEATGDVVGDIIEGIFDGLDDLPGLAIAGIVLAGVGVVAGVGFIGHKLLKKKK